MTEELKDIVQNSKVNMTEEQKEDIVQIPVCMCTAHGTTACAIKAFIVDRRKDRDKSSCFSLRGPVQPV
jgi:hypothetical protein